MNVRETASELLISDPRRKQVHRLSAVAAWVWSRCDGRTPVTLLAERMRWMFNLADPLPVLQATIERLAQCRLLEDLSPEWLKGRLSRRDVVTGSFGRLFALPIRLFGAAWV
jgi:hypothetical protein